MVAVRRILLIAALAAAAPGTAHGQSGDGVRQRASDTFTTDVPGAPAGRSFAVDIANPDDPEGKPPPISRVELVLHPGARFDTTAVARCGATDAELAARGEAACPDASRVGRGEITVDTGVPGPARLQHFDLTYFNAPDALIILTRERQSGTFVPLRGEVRENRLTIDVPPLPGTPPDGGANRRERATFAVAGRYLTTPPSCPPGGEWTNRVTYTYRDGVRQTATSTSPCRPGATADAPRGGPDATRAPRAPGAPARLAVARPPATAALLNRRRGLRVALRVDGALRDVRARLVDRAGRTVASAARPLLTRDAVLPLAVRRRARPGAHRVVVTAVAGGRALRAERAVRLR